MAVNPSLVPVSPSGQLIPSLFTNEIIALQRSGIEITLDGLPNNQKWKAKGDLYLSSVRLVFVAKDAARRQGEIHAFDIPLVYLHKEDFKQPIFGCNYLAGRTWPATVGGGPSGGLPPIDFKLYFTQGGVGTFLRLFFALLRHARISARWARNAERQQQQQEQQEQASAPPVEVQQLVQTAFVDPSDPSTLFLTQPIPDANRPPQPVYAPNYGKDEKYESMDLPAV